jgi:RecQ zinc-binding
VPVFDMSALENLRQNRFRLLEEMLGFASLPKCRRRLILEYFGETPSFERCGACDVCDPPKEAVPPWSRRMLETIQHQNGGIREAIFKTLRADFTDWQAEELTRLYETLALDGWIADAKRAPTLTLKAIQALETKVSTLPGDATRATLELHRAQHDVATISRALETDDATTEKRLLKLLERNDLRVHDLVSPTNLERIRTAAAELGFSPLARLKTALPGITDLEFKAARFFLERDDG